MLKCKPQVLLATLFSLPLLQSCASSNSPTPTISTGNAVCVVWKDIQYHSKTDNPDTIERIIANNAARDAYCAAPK